MSTINEISINIKRDDLDDDCFFVKHHIDIQYYCLTIGDITLWFKGYEDYKRFSLKVQSEFEKTLGKVNDDILIKELREQKDE